jgi:AraC-like DNA-binding protein
MLTSPEFMSDRPEIWQIDSLLNTIEVTSEVVAAIHLLSDSGVSFPGEADFVKFFYVAEGAFFVSTDSGPWQRVQAGDFAIFRPGVRYDAVTTVGLEPVEIDEWIARMNMACRSGMHYVLEGDRLRTSLISGRARIRDAHIHPVWRSLPASLIGPCAAAGNALTAVMDELSRPLPGSQTIVNRLLDTAVMQAVRQHSEQSGALGVILHDPEIGRVVAEIHRQPAHPWTLSEMANLAGISRSHFAERFRNRLGQPPAEYVTNVRMHRAGRLLANPDVTVAEAAAKSGYANEAAFSKAFRRVTGGSPGRVRSRGVISHAAAS